MLNSEETTQLQETLEALPHGLEFILYNADNSEFGRKIESFVRAICRISEGKLKAVEGSSEESLPASPCFRICGGERRNIIYAAVPERHQFAPFLKAMESMVHDAGPPQSASAELAQLIPPVEIWVLVSADCPRCPSAVEAAIMLSGRIPSASSFIIDAQQFPNLTKEKGIRAVPATVIDRRLVLIGNISTNRMMELVRIRGTDKFDDELVLSSIERGNIEQAVEQFRNGKGTTAILFLLQKPDLSARMSGLMLLEKALEVDPAAVRAMAPSLIDLLSHQDSRIRGDVADLLGKVGDRRAIPPLERLTRDLDPDVAEAAVESLRSLREEIPPVLPE